MASSTRPLFQAYRGDGPRDRLGRHEKNAGTWPRTRPSTSPPGRPASCHRLFELTPLHRWLAAGSPASVPINWIGQGRRQHGQPSLARPLGQAHAEQAIRHQIERYTQQAFGEPIWPHLFRHCAVTELVDSAPHEIAIAPDLLGHADLETTQRYYVLAEGMTAHVRVQEVIATPASRSGITMPLTGTLGCVWASHTDPHQRMGPHQRALGVRPWRVGPCAVDHPGTPQEADQRVARPFPFWAAGLPGATRAFWATDE